MYYQYNRGINNMDIMSCSNYNFCPESIDKSYENLEMMYPDTYKIIYPMVCSACNMIKGPITMEIIISITNDIYTKLGNNIEMDMNFTPDCRRPNNLLTDFISVLLIRELLDRRPNRFDGAGF